MAIYSCSVIKEKSRLQTLTLTQWKNDVQELLYHAAYHALKGNSDPLNFILEDAKTSKAVHVKALTRWVEFNLPVVVREEKFRMAKAWNKSEVKNEEEFEGKPLADLKSAGKWWDAAPKQKAESVWSADSYLNSVIDNLTKHGRPDLAKAILGVKSQIEKVEV
jgi:hypothetical protein